MDSKLAVSVFLSLINFHFAFGQGALTPPGAPAAMMKSLDQIEPRTPINTNTTPGNSFAQFVISQPGSYYLTGNIMSSGVTGHQGIEINTNNVTLDLNGFSLLGIPSVQNNQGIYVTNNCNNITVRNGIISGWGGIAIEAQNGGANDTFEHLTVAGNNWGFLCNGRVIIKDCLVASNSLNGILLGQGSDGSQVIDNEIAGNDTSGNAGGNGGDAGLGVQSSNNRIEGNHITGSSGEWDSDSIFRLYYGF